MDYKLYTITFTDYNENKTTYNIEAISMFEAEKIAIAIYQHGGGSVKYMETSGQI